MSSRDPDPSAGPADAEPVLQRWSRLKAQARAAEQAQAQPATSIPAPPSAPAATGDAVPPAERPPVELPDLDLLGQDSDYSAFLAPGVDLSLRRRALRKLFASPKFNVFDGLDTYRDDYTSFPALGDIVTADMRHQVERLAQKALDKLAANAAGEPRAIAAPVTAGPTTNPTTNLTTNPTTNPTTNQIMTDSTNPTAPSTPTLATIAQPSTPPAATPAPEQRPVRKENE
jgi:hypothetical protein